MSPLGVIFKNQDILEKYNIYDEIRRTQQVHQNLEHL